MLSCRLTEDLRWDWIGENLYWTDYNENEIEVYSMKTGSRAQLVHTGNDSNPRALVLDPNTRYVIILGPGATSVQSTYFGSLKRLSHHP